jgi:hypothetical protein
MDYYSAARAVHASALYCIAVQGDDAESAIS